MSQAFREGWDRIFGPRPPVTIHACAFNLRNGMVIEVKLPSDLKFREVRRFAKFLTTYCDEWDPERGLPSLLFDDERVLTTGPRG
jgi:hypothetical protein